MPSLAVRVLQVANDPASDISDLLEVIEQDPALATRLVKTVNSSYYGLPREVGDLRTAVTMLGMEQVRNLALTVVIGNKFSIRTPLGEIDPAQAWDHSLCVATAARLIATKTEAADPEEAYLAGLVHDLGLLVIDQNIAKQMPRVLVRFKTGDDWSAAEREVLSFDHAQLGAYIAWRSGFPSSTLAAIDLHHESDRATGESLGMVCIISVANYLVTRMGRGSIAGRRLPAPSETVFKTLDLSRQKLRAVWNLVEDTIAHVGHLK